MNNYSYNKGCEILKSKRRIISMIICIPITALLVLFYIYNRFLLNESGYLNKKEVLILFLVMVGVILFTMSSVVIILEKNVFKLLSQHEVLSKTNAELKSYNEMLDKIYTISFYDEITSISNRTHFIKSLTEIIEESRKNNGKFSVVYIGLDNFKIINETLGHLAGDELLKTIAERISININDDSLVSRIGSDEFALLYNEVDTKKIDLLCKNILKSVRRPWEHNGVNYHMTVSIGIAVYPMDGVTTEELIKNCQIALKSSKLNGKNNYLYYSKEQSDKFIEKISMENDLRLAIERNEFELYYQPQIMTETKEIVGMEALIRWNHPEKGIISPGVFIPVAEESELITEIGKWVLQEACSQIRKWNDKGFNKIKVSVNVSAKQFEDEKLVDFINNVIAGYNINPESLKIEITESIIIKNQEKTVNKLNQIRNMGINILLDDFGTGYSSLLYLKSFPIDVIKIDQNFVKSMSQSGDDETIIKTIIVLSKELKIKTIAEGVETNNQYEILKELGCDEIQGYLFGKPSKVNDIELLLSNDFKNDNGTEEFNKYSIPNTDEIVEGEELIDSVYKIIKMLDAKENDREIHSENVAKYAILLGKKIGLSERELEILKMGSLLHDCGKVGLDKRIIEKTNQLTDEEYEKMKSHSLIGYNMIRYIVKNKDIENCILYHHERYDGMGYPYGIKGKEIPVYARIISIADAYESMTYDKPFRKALDNKSAIEELNKGKGNQFDPELTEVFTKIIEEISENN